MTKYTANLLSVGIAVACMAQFSPLAASAQENVGGAAPILVVPAPAGPGSAVQMTVDAPPQPYLAAEKRLPTRIVDDWLGEPEKLLTANPRGGREMSSYVTLLAGSDPRTVQALVDLAMMASTNFTQRKAIAMGLAIAATDSEASSPEYAAWISMVVASSGFEPIIGDYAFALRSRSDIETAEIGGGPAGGGGGGAGSLTGPGGIGPAGSIGTVSAIATISGDFPIERRSGLFGGVSTPNNDPSSGGF